MPPDHIAFSLGVIVAVAKIGKIAARSPNRAMQTPGGQRCQRFLRKRIEGMVS
jgi:hypothetical protein